MGEIRDVEMGYVTTRRGARLHLVTQGGLSHCRSGSSVIIRARELRGDDGPNICKRCRKALRSRLVDVLNLRTRRAAPGRDLRGDPGNLSIIGDCGDLIDAMTTPAERIVGDEILETIHLNLRADRLAAIAPRPARHMIPSSESDGQLTFF